MKILVRILLITILTQTTLHMKANNDYTIAWYDKRLNVKNHTTHFNIDIKNTHTWQELFKLFTQKAQEEKSTIVMNQPATSANVCKNDTDFSLSPEQSKILIHPLCEKSGSKLMIVYGFQEPSSLPETLLQKILTCPKNYEITFVTLTQKLYKREKHEYQARQNGMRGMFDFRSKN